MVGCDSSCDWNTNSRFRLSRGSNTFPSSSVRTAIIDDRASDVIDCSSSPTADTIWSLMVSARVWLTCSAVRHHNRCTPTALTAIDVRTRAEMALRMPMRIEMSGLTVLLRIRDHTSVCFTMEAMPPRVPNYGACYRQTRLCDH